MAADPMTNHQGEGGHTPGPASMTPGQLLHELCRCFFVGGGWADYPEWSDYDEAGQAVWEAQAAAIGADIKRAAAAPDLLVALFEALPYVECAESDPAYKPGAVKAVSKRIRAAIAKATHPESRGEGCDANKEEGR